MTDGSAVGDWMDRYVAAWDSNEPADIRGLFTDDAEYRFHPGDDPVVGHEAIEAAWLAGRDQPDDHTFSWELVAIDGGTAVVQGRTVYTAGSAAGRDYDNLWVLGLAPDGRARSFTEWFVERGAPQ
jgi:ketosteroid isomerase-like protein